MNRGLLSLTFSDIVDVSTADPIQLTLLSTSAGFPDAYSLTGGRINGMNSADVVIILNPPDLNAIKLNTNLGTNFANSFLSLTGSFISDLSGNAVIPVSFSNALQVRSFTSDVTRPSLLLFSMNMTSGILSMTFSEPVNVASLLFSGITLLSGIPTNHGVPVSNYTLTDGTVVSPNGQIVVIQLSRHDLDVIIALGDLATSNTTTYLSASETTIVDMVHNPMESIPLNHPVPVSEYYGLIGKYN